MAHKDASDSTASVQSAELKWWHTDRPDHRRDPLVTNGGKLFEFLGSVDLTLNLEHGLLKITTFERAEEACCVRIYDVTSLATSNERNQANKDRRSGPLGTSHAEFELSEVIEITVKPDTWESLGGPSTLAIFRTESRRWLVVRAPLLVQWKVSGLLNRLSR